MVNIESKKIGKNIENFSNDTTNDPTNVDRIRKYCFKLATDGNKNVLNGNYIKAVQCFTNAIKNLETEFGFFINRALCFLKMEFFHLALLDINEAVQLNENNVKCYYIRSQVLKKLNKFKLAEFDLKIVIHLEPNINSISEEIANLKMAEESFIFKDKLSSYDLNDKTFYKIKVNYHLVKAKDLPSNIWHYHGIRLENIKPDADEEFIQYYFSIFGDIKEIYKCFSESKQRTTVFIDYFNPVTPMFTIAYFQNQILKELCATNENGSYLPLKLYFADYNSDSNHHCPLRPLNIRQECYYWRSTGCELNNCPKLHLLQNKSIDEQIWMKKF